MKIDPRFTKKVDSTLVLQSERSDLKTLFSGIDDNNNLITDLVFTRCDRDDVSSRFGNYFMSFNVPTKATDFPIDSSLSNSFPALQQMNVDKIVIAPIPRTYYSEFIDGRTITMYVPQHGGVDQDNLSAITLVSSTYTGNKPLKSESSPLLGDNIVFLFSDAINIPYTGVSISDQGEIIKNFNNTSWDPTGEFADRPTATAYNEVFDKKIAIFNLTPDVINDDQELIDAGATFGNVPNIYNTDKRTNANFSVSVPANYPDNNEGYNYDIPVGFVVLDKGFIVITHTAITENIPWTSGYTLSTGAPYTSVNLDNIYFTGTTDGPNGQEAALLTFKDVDTTFRISSVCLAMPREFYISSNSTWDRSKVLTNINEQSGFIEFDPIFATEVGLYNGLGELVGVAKLSEPVEKNYTNVITFNIDIDM